MSVKLDILTFQFETMKRSLLLSFYFLLAALGLNAQTAFTYDTRSDSISIEHYNIHTDVRDFTTLVLKVHTQIIF